MPQWSDVLEFAVLVGKRFWQLFTGGGIAVVALGLYERAEGKPVSWSAYAAVVVLCIVFALFYQGADQHRRLRRRIKIGEVTARIWPAERHGFCGVEYFIKILNLSEGISLEAVRVELIHLEPDVIQFLPVPLHIKHDDYESREFSINPASFRQVDILTGPIDDPNSQQQLIVTHTVNKERFPLPLGEYRLTIRASAKDTKPDDAIFVAWIDETGKLRCAPDMKTSVLGL